MHGIIEKIEQRRTNRQHQARPLKLQNFKSLKRRVFIRPTKRHQQARNISRQKKNPETRHRRGNQQHGKNAQHQHSTNRITQQIARHIPAKKRNARRHEILILIFCAKKPLVKLGQKPLQPHNQKKNLNPSQRRKTRLKNRHKIQHRKNHNMKINTPRKRPALKILIRRILKRPPQRRIKPRYNTHTQANIEIHSYHSDSSDFTTSPFPPRGHCVLRAPPK